MFVVCLGALSKQFKIPSAQAMEKAFSICSSHMIMFINMAAVYLSISRIRKDEMEINLASPPC